jgi:hypothetical protein
MNECADDNKYIVHIQSCKIDQNYQENIYHELGTPPVYDYFNSFTKSNQIGN